MSARLAHNLGSNPSSPTKLEPWPKVDTKLGPWGCLCTSFAHHMLGDGCEICNPELAKKMYEELREVEYAKD